MNLTKDEWICPVCNRPIGAEELIRDGLTNKILSQLDTKCLQVEFFVDGTYKPVEEKKPVESNGFSLSASSSSKKTADIVCIDLSDEDEQSAPSTANQNGVSSSSQARRPLAPTTTSNYDEDTELEGETSDDGNNDDDDDEKDEFDHYVNSTCSRFRRRNRVLNMSSSDDDDNVDGGDDVVPLNVDRLNESDLLTSACDATRITLTNHFLPSFSEMIDTDLHEGARKRMRTCSSSSTSRSSGYRSSRRKP